MALCSFAIAAGLVGVFALVKRLAFYRHFGGRGPWAFAGCGPSFAGDGGCGGGWHDGDHHGPSGRGRWRRHGGPGGSFWLRGLFARLDTTPGQEREIRAAIEEFQTAAREAKDGLRTVRADLARAIRGESFDEVAAGEASVRANVATSAIKDAFEASLKRVHAVLDAHQRERLAELLENGPGFGRRWGNPYRDAAL
jgi:Spy/CpxP family protein refolding chaperone